MHTQINQCSHLLPVHYHWGLIRMSHQMSNGVRVEKRNRGNLWSSFLLSCFHCGQFWFGISEEMLGACCWLLCLVLAGGWATFSWFSPDWFKDFAGVTHSQAMWPQPWHLKHWRELGSFLFEVPSLDPCVFGPWPPVVVVPVSWPTEVLQAEAVSPRPVLPLWELGQPGVFLSICPLPWPLCLGLFGVLVGLLPCPALVRAAINLAIWFPNSVVPSTSSVVIADLALTSSWASSYLLSALQAAIISWE